MFIITVVRFRVLKVHTKQVLILLALTVADHCIILSVFVIRYE
jgi:hypothetical protein